MIPELPKSPTLPYRIERLEVEGYRAFQREFVLDFPWPAVAGRPDVLVLGSANGVGKTSVLEAILWGGLAVGWGARLPRITAQMELEQSSKRPGFPRIRSLLRGDAYERRIAMTTVTHPPGLPPAPNDERRSAGLHASDSSDAERPAGWDINPVELAFTDRTLKVVEQLAPPPQPVPSRQVARHAIGNILRPGVEPVRIPGMLYFSSFRRVYEGNIDPQLQAQRARDGVGRHQFKVSALDLTLWKVGLLPDAQGQDAEMQRGYDTLNHLLRAFAGVVLAGKADLVDGHFQPFVQPAQGGTSFPLDNLSSGQKEAVSTLFLLWKYTVDSPAVVLIDEPELYLNREWHGPFLRRLFELVPHNQYILATHSKEVASAAPTGTLRMLRSPT